MLEQIARRASDLVAARLRDEPVVALQGKAGTRVTGRDARGLRTLRNALGDAFDTGFVLHTGQSAFHLEDHIIAAPIDTLWSPHT